MESPRSHASQGDRSDPLGHSASSPPVHRQPRSDCHEDSEHLRGALRSLKGERRALRARLQEREYVCAGCGRLLAWGRGVRGGGACGGRGGAWGGGACSAETAKPQLSLSI